MLNRTVAPEYIEIEDISIKEVEKTTIVNNIPVYILNSGEQELLKIDFVFNAGIWHESKNGVSYFTINMLKEGTKQYNAKQIAEISAHYGAFVEYSHANDRICISVYVLSKYLQNLVPLLSDLLFNPTFPEEELSILKNKIQQSLKINLEKTNYVAGRTFGKTLYPNHPYGNNLEAKDIETITVSDLHSFFKDFYSTDNLEIFIAGKVEKNAIESINSIFNNSIPTQKSKIIYSFETQPTTKQLISIEKEGSVQTSIKIGKRMFNRKHPDYISFLVTNEIFGGYFGSRLMKNIREDKGYTYGIYSSITSLKNDGYWAISADVKKEFSDNAISEIWKELEIMSNELVDEDELERVKKYMLGSFMNQLNTPFDLIDRFKTIHYSGLDYSYYHQFIHTIKSIDAIKIQEMAKKYFALENLVTVKVG